MSYDLQVWATRRIEGLTSSLPNPGKWTPNGTSLAQQGRGWQVIVDGPLRVEEEDVPAEVGPSLPGIRWLYALTLEPISAPSTALQLLKATAKHLAQTAHGAIFDPQAGDVILPPGVRRFAPSPAERGARVDLVSMSWWFTDSLLQSGGYAGLVGAIERWLPEAMPRRYGLHEPPQFQLAETGRDHFVSFLAEHDGVVWYPTKPVAHVHLACDRRWGWIKNLGFRANRLEVEVQATVLSQPGWPEGLHRFWSGMSELVKPFYGEVRTLGGYVASGRGYATDMQTEVGPTKSWWWRGIPKAPGYAVVLGSPYLRLWPEFASPRDPSAEWASLSIPAWQKGRSIVELTGPVPEALAQRWTPAWTREEHGGFSVRWNEEYPATFPFGEPSPSDRA